MTHLHIDQHLTHTHPMCLYCPPIIILSFQFELHSVLTISDPIQVVAIVTGEKILELVVQ